MKTKTVERLMNETPEHIKQQVSAYADKVVKLRKKAEDSWEGCDGCNDSDKAMWINGYIRGALANQIELPSDEEIEKESYKIDYGGGSEGWIKSAFRQGAKWMRDKINGGGDE